MIDNGITGEMGAFAGVIAVDLLLAGDNAIVVGTLAATLPAPQRRIALMLGVALAVMARIALSLGVVWLLFIPFMPVVGGLLLLWVAWKMLKDLRAPAEAATHTTTSLKKLRHAVVAIIAADVSMSLDNVLGVAGVARDHALALVFGLVFSVAIMGLAATMIASLISRHRWIGYVGVVLIVGVTIRMIVTGI